MEKETQEWLEAPTQKFNALLNAKLKEGWLAYPSTLKYDADPVLGVSTVLLHKTVEVEDTDEVGMRRARRKLRFDKGFGDSQQAC